MCMTSTTLTPAWRHSRVIWRPAPEETVLAKYADYFSLNQHDLDRNGVQTALYRPR